MTHTEPVPQDGIEWYDSPDVYDRRRSLTLWPSGVLMSATREHPSDIWSPPEVVARECDSASAGRIAKRLGLARA